ncbi:MAG: hypothetical protein WDZ96_00185 [Acidimicrobiia bacterium]
MSKEETAKLLAELEAEYQRKLSEIQVPWLIDKVVEEYEQAVNTVLRQEETPDEIESKADFDKRQKAYTDAINKIETTEELDEFMRANLGEVAALARAEGRFQEADDEDALAKISEAETVEELEALTNSLVHQQRQEQQDWLETRNDHLYRGQVEET